MQVSCNLLFLYLKAAEYVVDDWSLGVVVTNVNALLRHILTAAAG